mmetsp:Transcript_37402/g.60903  ORF Transcript_37402/g.60903 Transcript_37402/m.60903 type:complete len:85 (+) Transcript_37402:978-1232(+)
MSLQDVSSFKHYDVQIVLFSISVNPPPPMAPLIANPVPEGQEKKFWRPQVGCLQDSWAMFCACSVCQLHFGLLQSEVGMGQWTV